MVVIIPAKPFAQAKSRLAGVLTPEQRIRLSRALLRRTLLLAQQVAEVAVISRDRQARQLAKQAGAWALVEAGVGLNPALEQAREWVTARQKQPVLILPGDLPRLTRADLAQLIELGRSAPGVVLAPCHREDGTNALLLHPPGLIPFQFGPASFSKHRQAAQAQGLEPRIYRSPTLAFDLDLPQDWAELRACPLVSQDLLSKI